MALAGIADPRSTARRRKPQRRRRNALSPLEQARVVVVMTCPDHHHLAPLVPRLADDGIYFASKFEELRKPRPTTRAFVTRSATVHRATHPNQVWN